MRFAVMAACVVLLAAPARADMLPPNTKAVQTTIRVDGELPAGKALVLAHTREGGDPVPLGVAVGFLQDRFGTKLELFMIDAAQVPRIDELRHLRDGAQIDAILGKGGCGGAFDGERVTGEDSPIVEHRYVFNVGVVAGACRAELVTVEKIAAGPAGSRAAKAAEVIVPVVAAKAAEVVVPASPVSEERQGCRIGGTGGLLLTALVLLRRRRGAWIRV